MWRVHHTTSLRHTSFWRWFCRMSSKSANPNSDTLFSNNFDKILQSLFNFVLPWLANRRIYVFKYFTSNTTNNSDDDDDDDNDDIAVQVHCSALQWRRAIETESNNWPTELSGLPVEFCLARKASMRSCSSAGSLSSWIAAPILAIIRLVPRAPPDGPMSCPTALSTTIINFILWS